jgi:hypothetical protein
MFQPSSAREQKSNKYGREALTHPNERHTV